MLLAAKPGLESLLAARDSGHKAELQAGWVQRQTHTLLQCGAERRDPGTQGPQSHGALEPRDPRTEASEPQDVSTPTSRWQARFFRRLYGDFLRYLPSLAHAPL